MKAKKRSDRNRRNSAYSLKAKTTAKLLIILSLMFFATGVFAQDKGNENAADRTLKGSGRVNPSTLAMEFDINLGGYPGRGINVPIGLSYSSKLWRMESDGQHPVPGGNSSSCFQHYFVKYSEDSASGWTTSLAAPFVEYTGMQTFFNQDGTAVSYGDATCPSSQGGTESYPLKYVKRLLVHLPGGETHEMRADDTPVSFTWAPSDIYRPDILTNWNATYYAADGSNIVYVQNSAGNIYRLLMPDGSYYDFDSSTAHGSDRLAAKFTDRNGNYTQYFGPGSVDSNNVTHPNGYWKDTLGRNLSIPIKPTAPASPTTASSPQIYEMPGLVGESTVRYKLHWKLLKGTSAAESGLTEFSDTLRQVGDVYGCTNGSGFPTMCLYPSNSTEILFSGGGDPAGSPRLFGEGGENDFNPIVLTKIELPNGQAYQFSYDIYGLIEKIKYPTGGEEVFTYEVVDTLTKLEPDDVTGIANFGVVDRKLYETPQGNYYPWTYGTEYVAPQGFKVTINNPDGTSVHRYLHRGNDPGASLGGKYGYDNALAGMQYKTASFDSSGVPVSQTVTHWDKTTFAINYDTGADWHPRVTHEESYVYDPANASNFVWATQKYEYEGNLSLWSTPLLRKKTLQYNYQSSSGGGTAPAPVPSLSATPVPVPTPVPTPVPATLLRTSENTFLIYDTNYSQADKDAYYKIANLKNMAGLVTESVIKDASGTIVSKSETVYDETGSSPAVGRGNPTKSKVWDSTQGIVTNTSAYITTSAKFDSYGNLYEATDANGNTSTTTYDTTHNAYPVSVTSPVPDSDGSNGSNLAFVTEAEFDTNTGLPLTTTDANDTESSIEYDPETLRPVSVKKAVGTASEHETQYIYDDENKKVTVRSQIDGTNWAESISYHDGLGRTFKTEQVNSHGNIFVRKEFYDDGRVKRVSNPYRANETEVWTTNIYDDAGRVIEVELQDGAKIKTDYGVSLTGKIGTAKQITDQAGKKRKGISDALGRMIRVIEDPAGTPLETDYKFDTLGNLRETVQGVQHRYFMHDSLGRLNYSKQPEEEANPNFSGTNYTDPVTSNDQWSMKYVYDTGRNITAITNAEDSTVNAEYDRLNRIVKRDYSDTSMPDVDFFYDGKGLPSVPAHSKGQTTKIASSVSETRHTSFDVMGRVLSHEQRTTAGQLAGSENPYTTAYTYNLSGAVMTETYPSGRVITNTLDEDGILDTLKGTKPGQTGPKTYLSDIEYNSSGNIEKMRLGNGRWETASFNDRQQITQIGLGYSASDSNLLNIGYDYGSNTENNGSLKQQTINYTGLTSEIEQNYTYDALNRLKSATEKYNSGANQSWKQTFNYDRYGNREFDAGNTTTLAQNDKIENPEIEETTNRIKEDQDGGGIDYDYDKNGNLTLDAENKRMVYDAENRIKQFFRGSNGSSTPDAVYQYDGEGRRVRKTADGVETVFVYNAGGQLVAEYSTQITTTPEVSYLTADHLGSPRIVTDALGNVCSRHDYLAFGDEVTDRVGNVAGRTSGQGYGEEDDVRKQYTGYERDDESGLDYAQARYYNPSHGRYTGVDPLTASANVKNPQTFNRYSYVLNSPYKFTDPLGLISEHTGACGSRCPGSGGSGGGLVSQYQAFENSRTGLAEITPVFDWKQLSPDEQRIFNASSMEITEKTKDANGNTVKTQRTISGQELFNHLANGSSRQQRQLAGILNQTRQLETTTATNIDGTEVPLIKYVKSITSFDRDRIYINSEVWLYILIQLNPDKFERVSGHSGFPFSYKDNTHKYAGLQLSFSGDGTRVDVDSDIHNAAFSAGQAGSHFWEAFGNKITRHKTNPYVIYGKLAERGDPDFYTPNYRLN